MPQNSSPKRPDNLPDSNSSKSIHGADEPGNNKSAQANEIKKQLDSKEERYRAFIHNSSEGIWRYELEKPVPVKLPVQQQIRLMYDNGYLAETNDTMARMYGLESACDIVGSRLGELLTETEPQNIEYLTAFVNSKYHLQNIESQEKDHLGNTKYFLNSLVGVVQDGKLIRAWGTQRDITERREIDAALRASEARLALALQASNTGLWEWDITSNNLIWSDELKIIFGLETTDTISYEKYISLLHPDDLIMIQKTIDKSIRTGSNYEIEHRVIWPDGTVHWLSGRGKAIYKNNKPVSMIGTTINIDDRKSAEVLTIKNTLLKQEREELLRLNDMKDEFIAVASHQLRTPATSVKQYLGMLLEGYMGDLRLTPEQQQTLVTAYESNDRQISIINDLLLIATVDAGKVKLKIQNYDIIQLLKDITEDHIPKYSAKEQKLLLHTAVDSLLLPIDKERIRMAIDNLIDNASKYSPNGSNVTVSVRALKHNVKISIKDQGVGIHLDDMPRLFQKFSRIDNELSTSAGGTGLGLYWANEIVTLHGGTLSLTSSLGIGTIFTINLPLHSAHTEPAASSVS